MDYTSIYPAIIMISTAIVVLMIQGFTPKDKSFLISGPVAFMGVVIAFVMGLNQFDLNRAFFLNAIRVDDFGVFLSLVTMIGAGFSILLAREYLSRHKIEYPEYYALLLLAASGMVLLTSSGDFITFVLSLEIMSISIYILSGIHRTNLKSNEAAAKYLILGAFSTGFLLFGISLVYGATGTVVIAEVAATKSPVLLLGLGFMLIGFLFKVGAVPFQGWVPDVYEGAPTPVTALMAVGVKTAGFAAFVRIVLIAFSGYTEEWRQILQVVAVLSMILGNVVAISQRNLKRLLAYSSIAHTGYILLAFAAANSEPNMGSVSISFYLLTYTFTALGAFAVIIASGREQLDDFAGFGHQRPLLGAAMTIFFFSLAGIPSTAGFIGKLFVFMTAIDQKLYWASIIGIITSIISVYYYLRVVVYLYFKPVTNEQKISPLAWDLGFATTVSTIAVFALGIFPQKIIQVIVSGYYSMLP